MDFRVLFLLFLKFFKCKLKLTSKNDKMLDRTLYLVNRSSNK